MSSESGRGSLNSVYSHGDSTNSLFHVNSAFSSPSLYYPHLNLSLTNNFNNNINRSAIDLIKSKFEEDSNHHQLHRIQKNESRCCFGDSSENYEPIHQKIQIHDFKVSTKLSNESCRVLSNFEFLG